MKKMFVLLGLLLTLNTLAGERSALLIKYTSGEEVIVQTGIGLLELKQSYDHVKKTFLLSVNQTSYEFGEISELRFQKEATSVEPLAPESAASRPSFTLLDRKVVVAGVVADEVKVYSLDGKSVSTVVSDSGGNVTIDFSSCASGYYMIRLNTNSIKVCIR